MDLSIQLKSSGGDVVVKGNDFELVTSIFNQPLLGLFGGNVEMSTQDGTKDLNERFDYWGNELFFQEDQGQQFNSNFERELQNVSLTSAGIQKLQAVLLDDLKYLAPLGTVTANIFIDTVDRINIEVFIQEPGELAEQLFKMIWDGTRAEEIIQGSSITILNTPIDLIVTDLGWNKVKIDWTSQTNSKESGFEVWRSTDDRFYDKIGSVGKNVTTFTDDSLDYLITNSYKIRAVLPPNISSLSEPESYTPNPLAEAEAQSVIDKLTDALVIDIENKIRIAVMSMFNSGTWDNLDFWFGWHIPGSDNRLISWKGIKTGIAVNSPSFDLKGMLSDGSTNLVNTKVKPSTDFVKATLNDTHVESYVYENLDTGVTKVLFGSNGTGSENITMFQDGTTNIVGRVNVTGAGDVTFAETSGQFQDKTRYGIGRDDSSNQEIFKNGAQVATAAQSSSALSDEEIYVGAFNNQGVAANFINVKQSYLCIGGGFDLVVLDNDKTEYEKLFELDV